MTKDIETKKDYHKEACKLAGIAEKWFTEDGRVDAYIDFAMVLKKALQQAADDAREECAYVAIKKGVYRHDIVGVSTNKETAIRLAQAAAEAERDDYHKFEIIQTQLDKMLSDGVIVATVHAEALEEDEYGESVKISSYVHKPPEELIERQRGEV